MQTTTISAHFPQGSQGKNKRAGLLVRADLRAGNCLDDLCEQVRTWLNNAPNAVTSTVPSAAAPEVVTSTPASPVAVGTVG